MQGSQKVAERERTAICEYAVKTGAGCDTAAQGTHAAAVHLRMWQLVKHGKDTCRIEMRLGTLCVGMVTARTRGASDLVFPWLHSGALPTDNCGALLQRVCEAAKRLSGLWSRTVAFTGCVRDGC